MLGTGLVLSRLAFEAWFTVPVPFGDPVVFLAVSKNWCSTGFLGTALFSFDPLGQNRYVWHGFLSPWLYGTLNPGCTLTGFYLLSLLIKALTGYLVWQLGSLYRLGPGPSGALVLLTLAAQSALGFRPESLAILVILGAEWALARHRVYLATGLVVALAWTQPTVFLLYSAWVTLSRFRYLREAVTLQAGGVGALVLLAFAFLFPFPLRDLIDGLLGHAAVIANRTNESGLWAFYGPTHFLPGWALAFALAYGLLARKHPRLLLMLPAFWWFGPRVPPTYYNLVALLPALGLLALDASAKPARNLLAAALFLVGAGGLVQMSLRDGMTLGQLGSGLREARAQVEADLANPSVNLGSVEGIVHLLAEPERIAAASRRSASRRVHYLQSSGRPQSPCPANQPDAVGLWMFGRKVFDSTSGWQIYRCESWLGESDHGSG